MADDEWESFLDPQTGKRFYVNHRTRETSWEPPLREVALPPGWEERRDEEGRLFYVDHNTCTTSWVDPRRLQQQQQGGASPPSAEANATAAPAPAPSGLGSLLSRAGSGRGLLQRAGSFRSRGTEQAAQQDDAEPPALENTTGRRNSFSRAASLLKETVSFGSMGGGASQPQGSLNDSITVLGGDKSEQQEYDPATMRDLTEDDVDPYFVPDAARNTCFFCGDKFNLLTRGRHHCRCCGELVCDKCSQHKVQLPRQHETLKGEQRICEHCNTHISYGNFRCIVRYLTVLQGGSDTNAAQRYVALRLLEESLDPHTAWKGDPDLGDDNAQKMEDLMAAGGAVVLFGVLEPLLSPSLPVEVRRLALSTLAGALGVGFTTKYKDEFASELVDTQLLTLVLSALGEPGLQEQAARVVYYASVEATCQARLQDPSAWHRIFDLIDSPNESVQRWVAASVRPLVSGGGRLCLSLVSYLLENGGIFMLASLLCSRLTDVQAHALAGLVAIFKASGLPAGPGQDDAKDGRLALSHQVIGAVTDAGGIKATIDAMKSPDLRVVAQAINLAALLSLFSSIARVLWEEGAIHAVASFLSEQPGAAIKTVQSGLAVLSNLARAGDMGVVKEVHSLGGLNIALHYLDNADVGIRDMAASLVRSFSRDPLMCQEIVHCDGMTLLASHLEREDMRIASPVLPVPLYYNALVTLVALIAASPSPAPLLELIQRGRLLKGVGYLLAAEEASHPLVQRQTLRLLQALSLHDDAKLQALLMASIGLEPQAGSEPMLNRVIALTAAEDAGVVEAALLLLTSLSGHFSPLCPEDSDDAWELDGAGAHVLFADPIRERVMRVIYVRSLPAPLLSVPTRFPDHAGASSALLLLLQALGRDGTAARRLVETGAMATVVRFLKQGVGTQASVARLAFAELVGYGTKGPELSSGIECVAQALSDRSARNEAVGVLERCSANPACWASLVSFALPLLLDLFMEDTHLRTPTSDGGDQSGDARAHLARQMLTIVGRLSAQPEHGVAAMEMGYAFPIFHLLSGAEAHFLQGHGDMVHQALATLRLLLRHPPCVDSVVKMDQGHVLLHFLSLSAIPQGVLSQAMLCLDAITARSRQASAALAAERSTVDLLSDKVNTIGRATHNQEAEEEEEEEEGKAEGDAVLVRLLYRLAAYAEGEDARHLWEHMVTRHYLHTLVLLLRERPQGVDASGLRRVQSGACDALSLLVQADHADAPSSPASSLAATLVSTGVLQDLARVLSEVPAAMQTLALLCDGQPAACTTLLASPPFLSRAVALMEAGRTNASPQELRDAACSIHVLALAVREDPVAASRLLDACTSARLLKPLLTSLTLSTQHLDPGTAPLRPESRDALELLVATLCPHATHEDAQGLSDDDLILFHSCPGVVLASRHLHGLSRARALHCMARLSHSPKFSRALIGRHVVPDLLGLFTAAELQPPQEEEEDVEATRALALEILTHLSTSLPLITPEHLINAKCLDSFLPLLSSSPSPPPQTPQGFATARTRQKVLDLMTSMSASTTSVRRSLMSQGRLVPVLVALVSSAVTAATATWISRPATPARPIFKQEEEEEADAKGPPVDMPSERASALEAKGPPSPNSSSPLPSPVKSAPSSPIKSLPPSPVRVIQPAVEAIIRLPIPDSSCELALRSALRILTNLAKMDENRIEIATCPGLFSMCLAVICACPDLQSDMLLEACMLMQRLAMAAVDAEEALGEALLTKTMTALLGVLDKLQTHEHKDAAAPRVNESSAFLAFALTSLASTDAGQAVLQQPESVKALLSSVGRVPNIMDARKGQPGVSAITRRRSATAALLRDECHVFGVSHPSSVKEEEEGKAKARDLTAIVLSKYAEALLGLLVRLAQSGGRAMRTQLLEHGTVALAARFLPLYGHDEERTDLWLPCVLQVLGLLEALCALHTARQQLLRLLHDNSGVLKAVVAIKTGSARSCVAKTLRLLDLLGDLDKDPIAREEEVQAHVHKESLDAAAARRQEASRRPSADAKAGGASRGPSPPPTTAVPATTTTPQHVRSTSSGATGVGRGERRPSHDTLPISRPQVAQAPPPAPSTSTPKPARRVIRPPPSDEDDLLLEPPQWSSEASPSLPPHHPPSYPSGAALRPPLPSGGSAVPQPPPYTASNSRWQQPPSYSSVSSSAGSEHGSVVGSPATTPGKADKADKGVDGVHLLTPVAQDADQNDFVAPCGGCGDLLPLPDGIDYASIRCKKCGSALAMCM